MIDGGVVYLFSLDITPVYSLIWSECVYLDFCPTVTYYNFQLAMDAMVSYQYKVNLYIEFRILSV